MEEKVYMGIDPGAKALSRFKKKAISRTFLLKIMICTN